MFLQLKYFFINWIELIIFIVLQDFNVKMELAMINVKLDQNSAVKDMNVIEENVLIFVILHLLPANLDNYVKMVNVLIDVIKFSVHPDKLV